MSWASRRWGLTSQVGPGVPAGLAAASLADRPADEDEDQRASVGNAVSQVGIEPTTRGLKVPCSTTELLARSSRKFTGKSQENPRAPPKSSFHTGTLSRTLTMGRGRNDRKEKAQRQRGNLRAEGRRATPYPRHHVFRIGKLHCSHAPVLYKLQE